jgi:mannose-1-phosphate guanylyltransferase
MLPIADRPFLEHQLAHLARHGVTEVTFACGFLPQHIIEYFGEGERVGMRLNYVIEPEPLDTGGAIGFAARTVGEQRVLVCNGDVLDDLDIGRLVAFHEEHDAVGTIALTPVEDPSRYGLVRTDDEGRVLAFLEKPSPDEIDTNLINAGVYVLEPRLIARIPREGRCNIEREIFPAFVGDGLYARGSDTYWNDIGTLPSYRRANIDMLRGRVGGAGVFDGADTSAVLMADGQAAVSPDATLHAPVYLAPGVRVAAGATIGPDAVLCGNAVVEEGGRVARSVLLERARVEREAQVVDSVVGEDATVQRQASLSDGAAVAPAETASGIVRGDT